jgi:LacI family transcriptional regulator
MVTARHVAEKSGVSVSTVGRALSEYPRISALTKSRVRNARSETDCRLPEFDRT